MRTLGRPPHPHRYSAPLRQGPKKLEANFSAAGTEHAPASTVQSATGRQLHKFPGIGPLVLDGIVGNHKWCCSGN